MGENVRQPDQLRHRSGQHLAGNRCDLRRVGSQRCPAFFLALGLHRDGGMLRQRYQLVFVVGVADAGIGIPSSLRRNPEYEFISDDQDAILRATESEVTGTMEPRGIGLYHVTERVKAFRGEMAMISGAGFLMVKGGEDLVLGNLADLGITPYGGTIALVTLPVPHNAVTS